MGTLPPELFRARRFGLPSERVGAAGQRFARRRGASTRALSDRALRRNHLSSARRAKRSGDSALHRAAAGRVHGNLLRRPRARPRLHRRPRHNRRGAASPLAAPLPPTPDISMVARTAAARPSATALDRSALPIGISNWKPQLLQRAPAFERFGDRDLIGVIQIAADWQPVCQARHRNAERKQQAREIKRRRLALGIGIRRENDLAWILAADALYELLDVQLRRPDAVHGRD